MKKVIPLLVILLGIPIFITFSPLITFESFEKANPNLEKDKKWEYLLNVLDSEDAKELEQRKIIEGPILIALSQASQEDSLAVKMAMDSLKSLLPNKEIDYLDSYTYKYQKRKKTKKSKKSVKGSKLKINAILLRFRTPEKYKDKKVKFVDLIKSTEIISYDKNGIDYYNSHTAILHLNKISSETRKKFIMYAIARRMVASNTYTNKFENISYNKSNNLKLEDYPTSIFRNYANKENFLELNEDDKFILQKLYANDFIEQLANYLHKNYPWNFAMSYMDEDKAEDMAFIVVTFLTLFYLILLFGFLIKQKFEYSYLSYFVPIVLIFLYVLNAFLLYNSLAYEQTFRPGSEMLMGFILLIAIFSFVALLLWILETTLIENKFSGLVKIIFKTIVTLLIFLLTPIFLFYFLNKYFDTQIDIFSFFPYIVLIGSFLSVFRGVVLYLKFYSQSLVNEKDVEISNLKTLQAQSETKLLQSHINPHFLYNALNSIASLVHTSPDKSEKMMLSLSNLFRYSINKKGKQMSTIKEEVVMVQNYLAIESERFGERLQVSINVAKEIEKEEIPMFILQPLVENAIKHGVSKIRERGKIVLKIEKEKNAIVITVSDNGPDFPEGLVSGYGLQMVYDLLRLSYGDKASVSWQNVPEKSIQIQLPIILKH